MSVLGGNRGVNGVAKRNTVCTKVSDRIKYTLELLSAKTGKAKSEIIREAIIEYLEKHQVLEETVE